MGDLKRHDWVTLDAEAINKWSADFAPDGLHALRGYEGEPVQVTHVMDDYDMIRIGREVEGYRSFAFIPAQFARKQLDR